MARVASPASTVAFLYAHGIEVAPESLEAMMREALARLQRLHERDVLAGLTEAEVEALKRAARDLGYGLV